MHIVVHCVLCRFFGCLEKWTDINVKADIRKGGGNDFSAAIMAILAHLDDEHSRATPFFCRKIFDRFLDCCETLIALIGRAIDTCEGLNFCAVTPEYFLHSHADFPYAGACARRFDRRFQ